MERVYVPLYKTVSALAVVLENLSKPALYRGHFQFLALMRDVFGELYWALESLQLVGLRSSRLIRLVRKCQKGLYFGQEAGYELAVKSCDWLEGALTKLQTWFEGEFRELGMSLQDHWAFSLKHRSLVKEVLIFFHEDTTELQHLPTHALIRFNLFYMILQRRVRALTWKPAYDAPPEDQDKVLQDMSYYSKYAIGVYGHFLTIVCKGQTGSVFSQMTEEDILIDHARLNPKDLIYSEFNTEL